MCCSKTSWSLGLVVAASLFVTILSTLPQDYRCAIYCDVALVQSVCTT